MTVTAENQKVWARVIVPIVFSLIVGAISFAIGSIRAESASETKWQEIAPDIQKIRAMPPPDQVVTKDQFIEVIKRLDDDTQQIRADVQYLRSREEKRGR